VDRKSKMIVVTVAKEGQMSSEALALMTFREICCRFGLLYISLLTMTLSLSVRCGSPSGTCVGLNCASRLVTILDLTRQNVLIGRC